MRKILGIMTAIMLGSSTSLQVIACSDDSKYQDFKNHVNSGDAFFGILGAADCDVCKGVTDGLNTMQTRNNDNPSQWDDYLKKMKKEIDSVTNDGRIDILTFEKSAYANKPSNIVDQFWNDKTISWQRSIYHWLLDHKSDSAFKDPVTGSGVEPIVSPTDKDKKFVKLPIVFIVNKGKLVTVGQGWGTIIDQSQFFDQFKSLIEGNLLLPTKNNK